MVDSQAFRLSGNGRLPGIPIFSRNIEESYQDFIEQYTLATPSENWSDEKKARMLWRYLDNEARAFWAEQENRNDWNVIRPILQAHFVMTENKRFHHDVLMLRKRNPNESLAQYASAM